MCRVIIEKTLMNLKLFYEIYKNCKIEKNDSKLFFILKYNKITKNYEFRKAIR